MNIMDGFTNEFTLYSPMVSYENRKLLRRKCTKTEIQKCSVRKPILIAKESERLMFQNHHYEFKKVVEINGIMCMASLIFLNSEIIATISITGNEISSCFKCSYQPLKSNFSNNDFHREIQRLYFEICDKKLLLCVYSKDEFEEFLRISDNFKYFIVTLKGKYTQIEDFDDEGTVTMFSKIRVEDNGNYFKFILLPPKPNLNNNEISEFTQTDYSSSFVKLSVELNLKFCEVDKLEIKSFLYQSERDSNDIKYYIEECIVCTDYSEKSDILREADLLASNLNFQVPTEDDLALKNLPLSKKYSLLSSKSNLHEVQNDDKEIMTKLQSEKSHMKIYLKLMKQIYEQDQKENSELYKLGIKSQSYFDLTPSQNRSKFAKKTSLKQRSVTKTNLTDYKNIPAKRMKNYSPGESECLNIVNELELLDDEAKLLELCRSNDQMYTCRMIKLEYLNMIAIKN